MGKWWRVIQLRIIIRKIEKYAPEGVSYDPDTKIHCWRWTDELERALFRGKR